MSYFTIVNERQQVILILILTKSSSEACGHLLHCYAVQIHINYVVFVTVVQ